MLLPGPLSWGSIPAATAPRSHHSLDAVAMSLLKKDKTSKRFEQSTSINGSNNNSNHDHDHAGHVESPEHSSESSESTAASAAAIAARPVWAADSSSDSCTRCHTVFSLFWRRHHCRACGGLFCYACCDFWASIPRLAYKDVEPMCFVCFLRESGYHAALDGERTFLEFGDRDKPPLVLLNDAMCTLPSLIRQAQRLANVGGFRVFLLEYPGLGARFYEPLTEEKVFETIDRVVEIVGRISIFGYGMGGHLGVKYALRKSDNVAGVIVVGPNLGGVGPRFKSLTYNYLSRRRAWSWIESSYGGAVGTSALAAEDWDMIKAHGLMFQRWNDCVSVMSDTHAFAEFCKKSLDRDAATFRTMFVLGKLDGETVETYSNVVHRVEVVPDANHLSLVLRHFDQVAELVHAFLVHASESSNNSATEESEEEKN